MAAKTSGEIEKEFIENLKAATGNPLSDWLRTLKADAPAKRNDIVKWLKEEKGFGHMNAGLLAGIYLNGGKPVYGSTEELLENQFAKCDDMRPLFAEFVKFVKNAFPNAAILPKKTYVSILEKREFAAISIKRQELRIGFDLGDRPFDVNVSKAKLTGPMPRISHQVVLTNGSQMDDKIVELLQASYVRSH